jgi:hypothetical protein
MRTGLAVLALVAWGGTASAQQVPANTPGAQVAAPALPQQESYNVTGFRGANFGMTRDEVLKTIRSEFGLAAFKVPALTNSADGTIALIAKVGALEPGPGEATVTYIFGKSAKRLIHVNVVWLVQGEASEAQRDVAAVAGLKLASHFSGYRWADGTVFNAVPVGPNSVVLFLGKDSNGRAVEVRADGVNYARDSKGTPEASPPAKGGIRLRLAYSADADNPDIAHIGAKQF